MSHVNSAIYFTVFLLLIIFDHSIYASTLSDVSNAADCADASDCLSADNAAEEKQAGGWNVQHENPMNEKRGGGRMFQTFENSDRRFRPYLLEKRGGARSFGFSDSQEKRGGARMFELIKSNKKRGGAHRFQSFDEPSEQKWPFLAQAGKRGGARQFAAESPKSSFEKRRIADSETSGSSEKRGGARPFFGDFGSFKRGGARFFASPYSSRFYAPLADPGAFGFHKRAGGHQFSYLNEPSSFINSGEGNFQLKRAGTRNFVSNDDLSLISARPYFDDKKAKNLKRTPKKLYQRGPILLEQMNE